MAKQRKLPTIRRQYHTIVGVDSGLDYSSPSTMIAETYSPACHEMTFRDKTIRKSRGADIFAQTDVCPLTGVGMYAKQYIKNDETEKFIVHTTSNVYKYNSTSDLLECITEGVVVEDCEDVWSVPANVTCDTSTSVRKGTYSIAVTIATAFGTGVAAYENFGAADLSACTHLHFYIKSSVTTGATDLDIRISEENAGGTGGSYEDISVPALTAGVWKEVSVAFVGAAGTRNAVLSVSLIVANDIGAMVVNVDDVMATIERTGDEDDCVSSATINDYYVYNDGIAGLKYWDMATATTTPLLGATSLACRAMQLIGERLNLYWIPNAPRRVQWTVVGGLSITPVATDWTDPGSGDADLDSVFGDDVIMTAEKLGNYVVIYGKSTIAMQEYTGTSVDDPYDFYVRVPGIGTCSRRGVANIGSYHIMVGFDNVYVYKGGTDITPIGDKIRRELFSLINPTYIHRLFIIYMEEQHEVRIYFPLIGSTTPDYYFSYNLENGAWSRGTRSYTGYGTYVKVEDAATWDTVGTATTTWDEMASRWDDVANERLSPLNIYGDSSGIFYKDNESSLNNAGVAIDGWYDTKDFVVSTAYRRNVTNWFTFNFEATGDAVTVYYSTNLGESWSSGKTFTLTEKWKHYQLQFNVNAPQVRFRFSNSTLSQSYEVREYEIGYIDASDRGVE